MGRSDIMAPDPAYAKKLDRDNDNVACERKDAPSWFKPDPHQTSTGTKVETGAPTPMLPQTGPAVQVGLAGGAILLLGLAGAMVARRRKVHFRA